MQSRLGFVMNRADMILIGDELYTRIDVTSVNVYPHFSFCYCSILSTFFRGEFGIGRDTRSTHFRRVSEKLISY